MYLKEWIVIMLAQKIFQRNHLQGINEYLHTTNNPSMMAIFFKREKHQFQILLT